MLLPHPSGVVSEAIVWATQVVVNVSAYKREKAEAAAETDVSLGKTRAVALSRFPMDAAVDGAEKGGDLEEAENQDLLATRTSSEQPRTEHQ